MKKFLLLIVMVVMAVVAMAQSTNKISYQAVVRDAQNRLAINTNVSVKVTIGSYVETFDVTTNANGLMSFQIPNTEVTAFNAIDWSTASITTEVTIGSEPAVTNTVPVNAVPYSLYAADVNPNGAAVVAIYDKIKADSVALAGYINDNKQAIIDTADHIRTEMLTMNTKLQENIDSTSTHIRTDMNTMNTKLQGNIDTTSTQIRNTVNTVKSDLQANIDTTSTQIRSTINTMNTKLQENIDSTSSHIRTDMNTMNTKLQGNIDTVSSQIRGALKTVAFTGSYNDLSDIPTNLSQFTNDENFVKPDADNLEKYTLTTELEANYVKKTVLTDSIARVRTALADTATAIRNAIPKEMRDKFTATVDQTEFTLSEAPNTTNYFVKIYRNGMLIGDNADGVITVSGTTVTYDPSQNTLPGSNGNLVAGDRIVIYYFK